MSLEITDLVEVRCPFNKSNQYASVVAGKPVLQQWRITGFYKKYVNTEKISSWLQEILDEEYREKSPSEQLKSDLTVRMECCLPEEAEYVGVYAICGTIVPIEWVHFIDKISWKEDHIQQEQESQRKRATAEDWLDRVIDKMVDPRYVDMWIDTKWGLEGYNLSEDYYYYDEWVQKCDGRRYFEIGREDEDA